MLPYFFPFEFSMMSVRGFGGESERLLGVLGVEDTLLMESVEVLL